jgi:hypothetical protein
MGKPPTSHDFLQDSYGFANEAGHVRAYADAETTDAELYRIMVAQALREGRFRNKAEFDQQVRALGTVEQADAVIAFRQIRYECRAWQYGNRMVCDCRATWMVGDPDPPNCRPID